MSTFEDQNYKWRETYFVLFDAARRPSLAQITDALSHLSGHFELLNPAGDAEGRFESLTLHAPQDYSALDVSFVSGAEVLEQGVELAKELKASITDPADRAKLARLPKLEARFDILHFEQVVDDPSEDEMDEMLDPSALLLVMEALARLTHGVGVDPQSGTVM